MHTQLLEEKEITSRARKACEDVFQICSAGDTITQGGFHRDPVQTLLMRRGANSDYLITPIIESAAIQAEMGAAGAGELFLRMFSTFFRDEIARKAAGLGPDPEWHRILEKIRESSIPARRKDLSSVFSSTSMPFERIMKKCFDEIKADDKVMVRKVASSNTTVVRETGYTFEGLNIDPRFLSKGTWIRRNVRSFLIDGVIENVSEIHHMLEDISKKRVPAVIFCIDALPDITETLVKNFVMGNLDAVLVKVPVTEFHVNSLADLGTIFGLEPISAAKGDSISLGLKDQNTISERVVISRSQIAIEKISTRDAVRSHVLNLRKRIDDDMNLAHILEPRIGRMSSSTTKIDVGVDDMRSDPNIVERLDRSFRSLSKILKFGFIEKSDFEGFSSDKISLLFGKNHAVPAEMAYQSIKIFLSTREAIQSAAAGIKSI